MTPRAVSLGELREIDHLLLELGAVRLRIASRSMVPTLRPGDEVVVRPVGDLRPGDLVLFRAGTDLVCHRLVAQSDDGALLTRGDATSSGERVCADQVIGRVTEVRRRGAWTAVKSLVRAALLPALVRELECLQRWPVYRRLLRPLVARGLSYDLGLARGNFRYEWRALQRGGGFPALPASARPHLLVVRRGASDVGWSVLVSGDSGWRCEASYVRLRYRGLGIDADLERLIRDLLWATSRRDAPDHR